MSQVAQQDHLYLDISGVEPEAMTDETKKAIIRAYLAGTLLDCVLRWTSAGIPCVSKVFAYKIEDSELYVTVFDVETEMFYTANVGEPTLD